MYHIYGSMFILYMYVLIIIHIHSPVKVYFSKWKSTLFQTRKRETHLPSINVRWWGGTSSLPWVNKSIGEGENTCAFVLDSLWLWGGIVSTYIICYCIMFRNYSFVIFVVRPKRFCPFDPFGVLRLCLGMPLCYIYTHIMQADAWILSLCVSFGCYLQMWCVNVWNHVCIRWEHENSKRYSRSA